MSNESRNILNRLRDMDLNETKLLQFYEQMPFRKQEEMLILGQALHAINNNFLRLGIKHIIVKLTLFLHILNLYLTFLSKIYDIIQTLDLVVQKK